MHTYTVSNKPHSATLAKSITLSTCQTPATFSRRFCHQAEKAQVSSVASSSSPFTLTCALPPSPLPPELLECLCLCCLHIWPPSLCSLLCRVHHQRKVRVKATPSTVIMLTLTPTHSERSMAGDLRQRRVRPRSRLAQWLPVWISSRVWPAHRRKLE